MHIDLSTVWAIIIAIVTPVLTFSASALARAVAARLHIQSGSAAADDLDQALEHGVNLVIAALGSLATHNVGVTLPPGPVANAVVLVLKLAPAAVQSLGVTEGEVTQLLTAKISLLLGQSAPAAQAA